MTAWRFRPGGIQRVAEERWGIRHPVHVRRRKRALYLRTGLRRFRSAGWAVWNPRDGRHDILIDSGYRSLEDCLQIVAHELEHCAQRERMGIFTFGAFNWRWGYWNLYFADTPGWERLATLAEDRWEELLPAVKITTKGEE